MTARDTIPFGKYKGTPLGKLPPDYVRWLLEQDWFEFKNPEMHAFFSAPTNEDRDALIRPEERVVLDTEKQLLLSVTDSFKLWWFRAYGERLRNAGEMIYIPYLRVAIEAWCAAERSLAEFVTKPATDKKPITVPRDPPNVLEEDLKDETTHPDDEEVDF